MAQIPDIQLEDNREIRTPVVLVLDGSTSMAGGPIDGLNSGLQLLESELKADTVARGRVRVCVIRLGGNSEVDVLSDFTDVVDFTAPTVEANGNTPLGAAMELALDNIETEKGKLGAAGISWTRPWIFVISDGNPTDADFETSADRCRKACKDGKVAIFPIAVEGADTAVLSRLSDKPALALDGLKFNELFLWLSGSVKEGSQTAAGDTATLEGLDSWRKQEN